MRLLPVVFLFLSVGFLNAQSTDSVHNQYIKSYPDKFFLWPVLKQRTLTFELQDPKQLGNTVRFRPNNSYGLGIGMYVFDLGLELVLAIPVDDKKENAFGKTSAQDLQLNIISRKWGGDIFYQHYRGFYLSNPDRPLGPDGVYPQRPDIETRNIGLSAFYVFNSSKFSLRSAFTFADRQLRSAGSFLISTGFNSFSLKADSAILNKHYASRIGMSNPFISLDNQTFSIAPGYSYNFIIRKNFFFSTSLVLGPAIQWLKYEDVAGLNHSHNTVNTFADIRLALGYSNDRFFTGVTFMNQSRTTQFEDVQFQNSNSTFRLLFGWRFQESGVLKKSVWSLLPSFLRG